MKYRTVAALSTALGKRVAESGYSETYRNEAGFETDVWNRVVDFMSDIGPDVASTCLTSHEWNKPRSAAEWKAFCLTKRGPDVNVLGSNNRLDIVVRHPDGGSIGIEVKCLGDGRHPIKLTQGIGQAILALEHRERTLLLIHCGTVPTAERERLRKIARCRRP